MDTQHLGHDRPDKASKVKDDANLKRSQGHRETREVDRTTIGTGLLRTNRRINENEVGRRRMHSIHKALPSATTWFRPSFRADHVCARPTGHFICFAHKKL